LTFTARSSRAPASSRLDFPSQPLPLDVEGERRLALTLCSSHSQFCQNWNQACVTAIVSYEINTQRPAGGINPSLVLYITTSWGH